MNFTDFRLKVRRFLRLYGNIFFIVILVWAMIFFVNMIVGNRPKTYTPTTSQESHVSVINDSNSTPKSLQQPVEDMIKEYVGFCNEGNYQAAFDMLSDDCKLYAFDDNIVNFMSHVYTKIPEPREYAIQSYSTVEYGGKPMYVYEVKYTQDLLATGLTDLEYGFTSENMTFTRGIEGMEMSVGNYIYHKDIKSISENEYLKIDIVDKVVNYSVETYKVKLTNRSNYTVVIADGQELNEVVLKLPHEVRVRSEITDIVLDPLESQELEFTFKKFADDGDESISLLFSSIRVMEKYSGTEDVPEEVIQSEIDNALSKFSMDVNVLE